MGEGFWMMYLGRIGDLGSGGLSDCLFVCLFLFLFALVLVLVCSCLQLFFVLCSLFLINGKISSNF